MGGNSPVRDIYNMLKSGPGAEIEKLMKETGAKQSGLTADNKNFNKMQKGYQVTPS